MIVLTFMILCLIVVFAIDTRQKRRRFLDESKQKRDESSFETALLEATQTVSLPQ